ncbi:MAG: histidine kinase [Chloroflexi bacterium HGW-Chloroflexi-5]|jgi:response regulator RpfG family c-di-GMP phosphodiesterase|nr:MAG: histidine kinase [Chloroflexi bacterium HGW-Chloroflexi-5]
MATILIVDDDVNLLLSFERNFRRSYTVLTAASGKEGLQKIADNKKIALVISDMDMPEMDGIEFLSCVKKINSTITRIMLTGKADLKVAIQAVNEGNIFRFLTKPTTPEMLERIINDGLEQYRLINSEKVLLNQTLNGSLDILNEVLGLTNPVAFGRSSRIKKIVAHIISKTDLENTWQFDLAATFCLIGYISIPQTIQEKIYKNIPLDKTEVELVNKTPQIAFDLIKRIPRFESIAEMILNQNKPYHQYKNEVETPVSIGSQILKMAIDVDALITSGMSADEIKLKVINDAEHNYNPHLTVTLLDYFVDVDYYEHLALNVTELMVGMILDQDVFSSAGALLLVKGQEITDTVLPRIINFQRYVGVMQPIRILVLPPAKLVVPTV